MRKGLLLIFVIIMFSAPAFGSGRSLTLVTLDWPPYSGQDVKNKGFTTEIVKAAFKTVGYEVNIVINNNWDDAFQKTKEGNYDGQFPEYYAKDKAPSYRYSDFFSQSLLVLAKKKTTNLQYKSVKDLVPFKVGVVKGYINTPEIDNATNLKKVLAESDEDNLSRLIKNESEVIVIDKLVGQYILKKKFPDAQALIEFIEPPLIIQPLFLLLSKVPKDSEQVLKDFNRGLELIKKNGTFNAIMKSSGLL